MKKLILIALLTGSAAFGLACSGDDNNNKDGGNDSGGRRRWRRLFGARGFDGRGRKEPVSRQRLGRRRRDCATLVQHE